MKWAVWIPWLEKFLEDDSGIVLYSEKSTAESMSGGTSAPCIHGRAWPHCKKCWYQVVPWNEQAQAIANGKVKP